MGKFLMAPPQCCSHAVLQPIPPFLRLSTARPSLWRSFASRRIDSTSDDLAAAREWLTKCNFTAIPRQVGEISFSRSGGPGGQNVNKVNSKATLKVPLNSLLPLVPRILHPALQASRYYAARSHSLVIQSEGSRKQTANVDACYEKLQQLLLTTAKDVIPGEASPEQRDRVHKLYVHCSLVGETPR
ncbi:peptidyl-tRNA hydrolase domain protein [Aspergillus lucknowensis]|uniref:Prokaryotic-type class I peptide chain release factors domain-containing protein n=1 Tax=Aspergillus lucknowensis TaxID=176173 RepID=A0ABR4LW02_9EURO